MRKFLGEENILSIAPSNSTLLHNLTNVQISLHYDKGKAPAKPISFNLPLRKLTERTRKGENEEIYVTMPFQPPRQQFKIDVSLAFFFSISCQIDQKLESPLSI